MILSKLIVQWRGAKAHELLHHPFARASASEAEEFQNGKQPTPARRARPGGCKHLGKPLTVYRLSAF